MIVLQFAAMKKHAVVFIGAVAVLVLTYPASVRNQFLEIYPDPELESNVVEFSALENQMGEASEGEQRRVAYRQAWNFEMFLRLLWRYVR